MKKKLIFGLSIFTPLSVEAARTANQSPTMLDNPLGGGNGFTSINEFIGAIIDLVLTIAMPLLVVAFVYVGFLFVMAQGNAGKLGKARQTLLYTVIGAALIIGAKAIQMLLVGTLNSLQ